MKELRRFPLVNLILFLQINSVCTACTMPTAWFGLWYQHGMNSLLEITNDYIQTKGFCLDVLLSQQYYLFTEQSIPCTRCLKFIERHVNFLQYRESECIDTEGVSNVTLCPNLIAPDAVLYTLHRNNSEPQLCPIHPPYVLTNLIREHSVCHRSRTSSYINECANIHQFHLHLSACSSSQSDLDLQLICVGTWIEHLHTYFVARILSPQNNQYACFRYSNSSSMLLLHMATDDSCHDLYSRQMSTVMTLSSKNHSMITQSCTFPNELQSYEWYSINRTIRVKITNHNIELIGINQRFHCQKMIRSEKSTRIYRIRTYTDCHMKEECLHIIHPTDNILELSTVSLSKENHCHHHHHPNFYLTFYTKSSLIPPFCPNSLGHLLYQSSMDYYANKSYQMSIGCSNKQNLIISEYGKDSIIQIATCLASWRSDDLLITYLLAQASDSNASYCLSFQMTNPMIIHNNSQRCSFESHEDRSIYSARMIHPCSQASKISSKFLLWIIFSLHMISHSKQ